METDLPEPSLSQNPLGSLAINLLVSPYHDSYLAALELVVVRSVKHREPGFLENPHQLAPLHPASSRLLDCPILPLANSVVRLYLTCANTYAVKPDLWDGMRQSVPPSSVHHFMCIARLCHQPYPASPSQYQFLFFRNDQCKASRRVSCARRAEETPDLSPAHFPSPTIGTR